MDKGKEIITVNSEELKQLVEDMSDGTVIAINLEGDGDEQR